MLSTVTSRKIFPFFARVARSGARLRGARRRTSGVRAMCQKAINILVITAMLLPGVTDAAAAMPDITLAWPGAKSAAEEAFEDRVESEVRLPDTVIYEAPEHERLAPEVARSTPEPGVPSKPAAEVLSFTLTADPGMAGYGDEVSMRVDVTNNSEATLRGLTFRDHLEQGFEFVSSNNPLLRVSRKNISALIPALEAGESISISYVLRIGQKTGKATGEGELWVHTARLQGAGGTLKAQAELWIQPEGRVEDSQVDLAPADGGWVQTEQAAVFVPGRGVGNQALLVVRPGQAKSKHDPELVFEIELIDASASTTDVSGDLREQATPLGEKVAEPFVEQAFLEIEFAEIGDLDALPGGKQPYVATFDEEHQVWIKVPLLQVDYQGNSVTVATQHFSTWGAGIGDSLPGNGVNVLLFEQPYTSLFTGSARYGLPIWTPPGRNGMSPDISLAYSSATVDGVLADIQAPWVGMGWNIDGIDIVRKISTDENGYGYEDEYALTFNGTKYDLYNDPDNPQRYYTKRASFLYIERHNLPLGNAEGVTNAGQEWWQVVATDGTRYRLGWNQDAEQMTLMYGYGCSTGTPCETPDGAYASLGYAGVAEDMVAMRWRVDRVLDRHGNYIAYSYAEEQPDPLSLIPPFDRASYLESVAYTGYLDPQGSGDLDPGYEVHFELAARTGDTSPNEIEIWMHYDSQLLDKIEVCYGDCDGGTRVRRYDLGYAARNVPNANGTLVLSDVSISGGGYSENGISIPATDAATLHFEYADQDNRAVEGEDQAWAYPRLVSIDNGYGGQLAYSYETDGRGTDAWYHYRVSQVNVSSGVGAAAAAIQKYAYTDALYTGEGSDPDLGELIGYEYTRQTGYEADGSTAMLTSRHHFGTDTNEPLDFGRTLDTEWIDPDSSEVLRKTVNSYVTDNSQAPFEAWNYRYLQQTQSYERSGSELSLVNQTKYVRHPGTGVLTEVETYLGSSLYRSQNYEYYINLDPNIYILDKVKRSVLSDANGTIAADVRYMYDGVQAAPTIGDLTLVQTLTGSAGQTVDVGYSYDVYGNLIAGRAYNDYGSSGSTPTGTYQETQTSYDSNLFTYPVTVSNALNQSASTSYLHTLGLPYQVTDPNSYVSTSRYDGLGRVLSSTAPGFGQPTVQYSYPAPDGNGSVSAPYAMQMQILDTMPATPVYRSVWGVYDGLGRILQNQVYDADSNNLLVTDSDYNHQGLVWRVGEPRVVTGTGGVYSAPSWGSLNHTQSEYDRLGRVIEITAPGDIVTQSSYDGLTVTVVDPNGHKTERDADGLGRMTRVREYSGEQPSWSLYATTIYTYDVADRLARVTDAQFNYTHMAYNWLGQKIQMDDPDMGEWSYQYDALGNLIQQDDARGQTLVFSYDALNRLTAKGDADTSTLLSSYSYGEATGVIGYRTAMTDQVGSSSWSYSNYGRSVSETRTIDSNSYTTTSVADWLGRVETVTYPDSEVVTTTYDALGRAKTLSSSQTSSLATLAYNSLGQISENALGNGVTVQNCYAESTHRLAPRLRRKRPVLYGGASGERPDGLQLWLRLDWQHQQPERCRDG